MTRNELFHDPLLAQPPVSPEDPTEMPERRTPEPRQTADRLSQRSLELLRVQDELTKMARASRRD